MQLKTQLSILVKTPSPVSNLMSGSMTWMIDIIKKNPIYVSIDQNPPITLKGQKEPYVFDLEPGRHTVTFQDSAAGGKKLGRMAAGALMGAGFGMGLNASALSGAMVGMNMAGGNKIYDNGAEFTLQPGDIFKLQVQAKANGSVKVKQL